MLGSASGCRVDEQAFTELVGGPVLWQTARASRPRLRRAQDLLSTSPSGSMVRPTLDTPTSTPVMMEESESLLSAG